MGMVAYSDRMRVNVLYFAILKDVFGRDREAVELATEATVQSLLDGLRGRAAAAGGIWESMAVAVNQEYATADVVLRDGDEVALLPPVSGGCAA
ncbi:molybdopterin converting factor subunit 1 [soil metagenome]